MNIVRLYLHGQQLTVARATSFLRLVFVVVFMGQLVIAMLTGIVLLLATSAPVRPGNPLLGWVLLAVCLPQLPVVLYISTRGLRAFDRGSALSSTLLAAVMLSTPAWFLSLALISRQPQVILYLLLGVLLVQYAIGMFLTARLGRLLIPAEPAEPAEPAAAGTVPGDGADPKGG